MVTAVVSFWFGFFCGMAVTIVGSTLIAARLADDVRERATARAATVAQGGKVMRCEKNQGICLIDSLNVREGPSTDSRIVVRLSFCTLAALADYPNPTSGDWIRITFQEHTGWVYKQYFSPVTKERLCIGFVLASEGGYSTVNEDPGNWTGGQVGKGELKGTKYGISAFTYPHLAIEDLTLADAYRIYRDDWYEPMGIAGMPWPLALWRFDTAVLFGKAGEAHLFRQYMAEGGDYLQHRINRHQLATNSPFGEGWTARVYRLQRMGTEIELPDEGN